MTQTQKFLKQIPNSDGWMPKPSPKVTRRIQRRGAEYMAHMDAMAHAHAQKRAWLLQARKEAEAKAAAAAKAAQKKTHL